MYITLYSITSLMWTAKGRTKSVHNSEVSTLVKPVVATGYKAHYIGKTKRAGRKVSTVVGCPQQWGVHRARFYCITIGKDTDRKNLRTPGKVLTSLTKQLLKSYSKKFSLFVRKLYFLYMKATQLLLYLKVTIQNYIKFLCKISFNYFVFSLGLLYHKTFTSQDSCFSCGKENGEF